jgi:hypothetical protein
MQNIDFYSRRPGKSGAPGFDASDPEYFPRVSEYHISEGEKSRKKASRMTAFIIGLCIVSFTAGLVIGIKFAGGSERRIIDTRTKQAVGNIGKKMTSLVNEDANATTHPAKATARHLYPRSEYPYVIRVGNEMQKVTAHEIAGTLSSRGHTVILSKGDKGYRLYTGPYGSKKSAESSLKKINDIENKSWTGSLIIVKR